jgi:hypothetical protein
MVAAMACSDARRATIAPSRSTNGSTPGENTADRATAAPAAIVLEPRPEELLRADQGETSAAAKLISLVATLRDSVVETKYQARTEVKKDEGYYAWDCSGMAAWMLRRAAPRARRALGKGRPVARDFFKRIDKASTERARAGWKRLGHVSDARPGDVFAWLRSPASQSRVTGHVGFFVDTPQPHPDHPDIYVARIVDATSLPHGDDSRSRDGDGGFGFGTILLATDASGETIGYGWHGQRSLEWGFMPARVIYGRVTQ